MNLRDYKLRLCIADDVRYAEYLKKTGYLKDPSKTSIRMGTLDENLDSLSNTGKSLLEMAVCFEQRRPGRIFILMELRCAVKESWLANR